MKPTFGPYRPIPYKPHSEWKKVSSARLLDDPCKGSEVNRWVNDKVRYVRDAQDHWQAPAETLERMAGDCEDFAILKRAILILRGLEPERAHIVVGYDLTQRTHHAVLLAGDEVLDCLAPQVLKPLDLVPYFTPMFAYGVGSWVYGV